MYDYISKMIDIDAQNTLNPIFNSTQEAREPNADATRCTFLLVQFWEVMQNVGTLFKFMKK